MGTAKQTTIRDKDIIKVSEVGQYHYCSIAWYLQKCGYKPKSPLLDIGTKKHIELGRILDNTQAIIKRYKALKIIGYLMLIKGILIFLFGVI
jgi:hypothetical protein